MESTRGFNQCSRSGQCWKSVFLLMMGLLIVKPPFVLAQNCDQANFDSVADAISVNARPAKFSTALLQTDKDAAGEIDVIVEGFVTPSVVRAGETMTYQWKVKNIGQDTARDIAAYQSVHHKTEMVSASSSKGKCRQPGAKLGMRGDNMTIVCAVGDLGANEEVIIEVVVKVDEFGSAAPGSEDSETISIACNFRIALSSVEVNTENNQTRVFSRAKPSLNAPPTVSITSSFEETLINPTLNPISIPINIRASDSDGSVTNVIILGNAQLLGEAVPTEDDRYLFTWNNPPKGETSLVAIATDNLGRYAGSPPVELLVNAAPVTLTGIDDHSLLDVQQNIGLEVSTPLALSQIGRIDLFSNGIAITNTFRQIPTKGNINRFRLSPIKLLRGRHILRAVITDINGEPSYSNGLNVTLTPAPSLIISLPPNGFQAEIERPTILGMLNLPQIGMD